MDINVHELVEVLERLPHTGMVEIQSSHFDKDALFFKAESVTFEAIGESTLKISGQSSFGKSGNYPRHFEETLLLIDISELLFIRHINESRP